MKRLQMEYLLAAAMCAIIIFTFASSAAAGVIYVKWNSPGSGSPAVYNGKSWDTAFHKVQDGLNAAVSGDEVWVAGGTYVENITMKDGVAVYGGFSGSESSYAQRNCKTNETILDGNKAGSVVTFVRCATTSTRLDGFTIRNGTGKVSGSLGGGIYCSLSSPVISNNLICSNTGVGGAGIYTNGSSSMISDNVVRDNQSTMIGGGIEIMQSGDTLAGNVFIRNSAQNGGGMACIRSSATIANNSIVGNAAAAGGVYYVMNGTPYGSGTVVFTNNIVAFNNRGIYSPDGSHFTPKNCCVYGNTDYDFSGFGPNPIGTNGNISSDPKFADVWQCDLHIRLGSPCIDAGTDSVIASSWSDMDGQARVQGFHVDIGADESDGTEPQPAQPFVVRVSPNGSDSNDGSTWALAKKTVQAGVNTASPRAGEVWVKAGAYKESVTISSRVGLYGGFAGTETGRSQRDWKRNTTAFYGDSLDIVVYVSGVHSPCVIDGFTIENGERGICCAESSAVILNDTIVGCSSSGISFTHNSSTYPIPVYCTISNNHVYSSTDSAAAIWCYFVQLATITDNVVADSCSDGIGCSGSNATVLNNTCVGNGGSGISSTGSSVIIVNNILAHNNVGVSWQGGSTGNSIAFHNNCAHGNRSAQYSGFTPDSTNKSDDPKFGDAEHIKADSPCIDAGDDSVVQSGWQDIDGQARIQGSHVDIGADESDGTHWDTELASVVRVSPDGDDANDGSSWLFAKRTIQGGVDLAYRRSGEVWVRKGVYLGCIFVSSGVRLYGGFAGTETVREQRNSTSNVTVLDGDSGGRVVTTSAGLDQEVVDGFTIRNGTVGVYCNGSVSVANNRVTGNTGTGIWTNAYSSFANMHAQILNNVVAYNHGAGIYCTCPADMAIGNTVVGNDGTGIAFGSAESVTVANNLVCQNQNGMLWQSQDGSVLPTVHNNCVFGSTRWDLIVTYTTDGYSYIERWISPSGTNISADPKLVSSVIGDLHIQPDSPCVDRGDDSVVQATWFDVDHEARTQGAHVDIGADESDGNIRQVPAPEIVRVSSDGDDANDGSSWLLAKKTIQAAVDEAVVTGGEVWVRSGTYHECITLMLHTELYGGFDGTETDRSQRDWNRNVTALYGKDNGSVVVISGGQGTVVDGFTISNGNSAYGGGVWCMGAAAVIANDRITGNTADYGGGVYSLGSSFTLDASIVTGNTASSSGGGVCMWWGGGAVHGNTITSNRARFGGGLDFDRNANPQVTVNVISENAADYGGGVYFQGTQPILPTPSSIVSGNTIRRNSASDQGGGVYWQGEPMVYANTISENTAVDGGGVYAEANYGTWYGVAGNEIFGNTATNGGGVFSTGVFVSNNQIVGNTATNGGGVHSTGLPAFTSNTIIGNTASAGGGLNTTGSIKWIRNNIIAFNSSGVNTPPSLKYTTVSQNDVYANNGMNYVGFTTDPTGTYGNISADPLFVNRTAGDYHLLAASPCVDAGQNDPFVVTDMDGAVRPQDGNGDGIAKNDIGAYEYPLDLQKAKTKLADGSSIAFGCAFVTGVFPSANSLYVERMDRSSGIRIDAPGSFTEGQAVNVSGTIQTDLSTGERYVSAATSWPQPTGASLLLRSMGLINSHLGGGPAGLQDGVWSNQLTQVPGDGYALTWVQAGGMNNIGLLVTSFGNITYAGDGFFYVDDGCALDDGSGHIGVKVSASGLTFPTTGFVKVTGISSCEKTSDGKMVRVLKVRTQDDIVPE